MKIKYGVVGVGFTFAIALAGFAISHFPWFAFLGPMTCAILIAITYRQIRPYPHRFAVGIQFSTKHLLRIAIVLYGLKINIGVIVHEGLGLLVRDVGTVLFSIAVAMLLARWLKADRSLSLLVGIGTAVCGAAAIAAVSPILKSKEQDTALGVGMIALVGTVFAVAYPLLRPLVNLSDIQYGVWSGVSLHEIAHVALAAAPAGQDALSIALLAKLGRVFLLIPLCLILLLMAKRKGSTATGAPIQFPWFLAGFLLMSILSSYYQLADSPFIPELTSFLLTMAMAGLGLNVRLQDLRTKAWRPLLVLSFTSILLTLLTFFLLRI